MQFLKKSFKNNKEIKLYEYLNSYWVINRGINTFNYFDIIIKQSNSKNLENIFITNNIIESFYAKISNYLPKGPITSKSFYISIINILKDSVLNKNAIKRHDYKTKTLINISKSYNDEGKIVNYKWYTYKEFYEMEKNLIKHEKKSISEEEMNIEISSINDVDELDNIDDSFNINEIDDDINENDLKFQYSDNEEEKNYFNDINEVFEDIKDDNLNIKNQNNTDINNSKNEIKDINQNSIKSKDKLNKNQGEEYTFKNNKEQNTEDNNIYDNNINLEDDLIKIIDEINSRVQKKK